MVLEEGVYEIPDDCTVYVVKRKINVVKKKIKTQPNLKRCRDCVHCKSGRLSVLNQFWDSNYCDVRPKQISGKDGYFYATQDNRIACYQFEEKKDGNC